MRDVVSEQFSEDSLEVEGLEDFSVESEVEVFGLDFWLVFELVDFVICWDWKKWSFSSRIIPLGTMMNISPPIK